MTFAQIPHPARTVQHEAADVWARINRVFAGSYTTPGAYTAAIKDLQRMEALTKDLRRALKVAG